MKIESHTKINYNLHTFSTDVGVFYIKAYEEKVSLYEGVPENDDSNIIEGTKQEIILSELIQFVKDRNMRRSINIMTNGQGFF